MRGEAILSIEGVSKSFGGLMAVSNVSFQVPVGAIKAVIGPNGAGKSTLIQFDYRSKPSAVRPHRLRRLSFERAQTKSPGRPWVSADVSNPADLREYDSPRECAGRTPSPRQSGPVRRPVLHQRVAQGGSGNA